MKALLLPTLLLLALSSHAFGQAAPPTESKPNPDRIKLAGKFGPFQIDPVYNYAEAYAGGSPRLKIIVTGPSADTQNLEVSCTPEGASSPLTIESNGTEQRQEPPVWSTDHYYTVMIAPNAEPRQYRINLTFHYPGEEVVTRFFSFKVGVRSGGKLTVVQDNEDLEPPTFYTGQEARYLLTLRNDFPDYAITVTKISVESVPESLVEFTDNALAQPVTLKPAEQKRVELRFKVNGMSFTSLVSGFGDSPKLKLNMTYNDGYEREVSDFTHKLNVKIRPRDSVLVMAMLAGVLVGGLIRFYLEFLARRKSITRREMLKFVLYTVLFGMVVTAFAFFGQIQIIAFKANGSYDKPMALFIIGLAGAVGGLQLFVGWYNSFKPAAEKEEKKQTPRRRRKREPTVESEDETEKE